MRRFDAGIGATFFLHGKQQWLLRQHGARAIGSIGDSIARTGGRRKQNHSVENSTIDKRPRLLGWFTTANPELRPALSNNIIGDYCIRNHVSADDFQRFRQLCDEKLLIEPL